MGQIGFSGILKKFTLVLILASSFSQKSLSQSVPTKCAQHFKLEALRLSAIHQLPEAFFNGEKVHRNPKNAYKKPTEALGEVETVRSITRDLGLRTPFNLLYQIVSVHRLLDLMDTYRQSIRIHSKEQIEEYAREIENMVMLANAIAVGKRGLGVDLNSFESPMTSIEVMREQQRILNELRETVHRELDVINSNLSPEYQITYENFVLTINQSMTTRL